MSKRPQADTARPAPRLYLVTPAVEDALAMAAAFREALPAADVAAVLLRLKPADERTLINRVKALAPVVQDAGVALLIDDLPGIVARSGADGGHITGLDEFSNALGGLKPDRIAGCGGLHTRDDAMTAAERGADYVMFGEPHDERRPAFEAVVERVAWWAEVFEVPCVGYADNAEEIGELVAAGADFVAVGEWVWQDPRGLKAALASAAELLTAKAIA